MIDRFLRAPRLPLLLFIVLPLLSQWTGTAATTTELSLLPAHWGYYLSSAGSLVVAGVLYGWMWSVGTGLQAGMSREFRRSTIGFGAVLLTLGAVALAAFFYRGEASLLMDEGGSFTVMFWTLFPLLGLWMAAHLYCASYVADILISAERDRQPTTDEWIHLSLKIWLFPVGVWMVQPSVTRLVNRSRRGGAAGAAIMTARAATSPSPIQ